MDVMENHGNVVALKDQRLETTDLHSKLKLVDITPLRTETTFFKKSEPIE